MLAARESRTPGTLRAIGAVVLASGVATPLFGVEAARARLKWEAANVGLFRLGGAAFVFFAGLIISALRSGRPVTSQRQSARRQ